MRLFGNILPKTALVCIGLLAMLVFPSVVQAQDATATVNITVNLRPNGSANVVYNLDVTNRHKDKYVNSITIEVPYSQMDSVVARVGALQLDSKSISTTNLGSITRVTLNFPQAVIKDNQTRLVSLQFNSNNAIKTQGEFSYLDVPQFVSQLRTSSVNFTVTFPDWDKELLYVSKPGYQQGTQAVTLTKNEPMYLMWGPSERTVSLTKEISNQADQPALLQLPAESTNKMVEYSRLDGMERVAMDDLGNYWAVVDAGKRLAWQANVQLGEIAVDASKLSTESCVQLSVPEEFANITRIDPEVAKNYFAGKYQLQYADQLSEFDAAQLESKATETGGAINRLELACLIQSVIARKGTPSAVVYGYYSIDIFRRLNPTLPYAWIVYELDGKKLFYDPYFNYVTGLENREIPQSAYILMGIFDSESDYDNALGMRIGRPISRPQIDSAQVLGAMSGTPLDLEAEFPAKAHSGEFFAGYFVLTNNTNQLIDIESVRLDGEDYNSSFRLYEDLYAVAVPGRNYFDIDFLREPNFLRDDTANHTLVVQTALEQIPEISSNFSVRYQPDPRLFVALLVLVSLLAALTGMITLRMLFKDMVARRKAYNQVYRRKNAIAQEASSMQETASRSTEQTKFLSIHDIFKD